MQLHERFDGQLVGISLAVDYEGKPDQPPDSFRDEALTFLQSRSMICENVISKTAKDDVLKSLDLFGIPAVIVYDREGNLHKPIDSGSGSYEENVIPLVEKLLKE